MENIEIEEGIFQVPNHLKDSIKSRISFDSEEKKYMMLLDTEIKNFTAEQEVKELDPKYGKKVSKILGEFQDVNPEETLDKCKKRLSSDDQFWVGGFEGDKIVSIGQSIIRTGQVGDLAKLYTLPDYRERGFGKSVALKCIEKLLEKVKRVFLMVREGNKPAFNLYRQLGFEKYYRYTMLDLKTGTLRND